MIHLAFTCPTPFPFYYYYFMLNVLRLRENVVQFTENLNITASLHAASRCLNASAKKITHDILGLGYTSCNQLYDADFHQCNRTNRNTVLFYSEVLCGYVTSIKAFRVGVSIADLFAFRGDYHGSASHQSIPGTRPVYQRIGTQSGR